MKEKTFGSSQLDSQTDQGTNPALDDVACTCLPQFLQVVIHGVQTYL
jgi:hypothetical protein